MKRMLILMVVLLGGCTELAFGATKYVSSSVNRQLSAAGYTAIGVTRPNYEWRFADSSGVDYDTVGGATQPYRNYGSSTLTTGLTNGNAPSLTEGILQPNQGAETFNGTTNYLYINDGGTALNVTTGNFTVAVWYRVTAVVSQPNEIISHKGNPAGWSVLVNGSYVPRLHVSDGVDIVTASGTGATQNTWNCFVGTHTFNDSVRAYLNGARTAATGNALVSTVTVGFPFTIGKYAVAASDYYTGNIAYVAFWNSALSDANVLALYNAQAPLGTLASPYSSIQSAVYAGAAGDTILVGSGRYQETVVVATAFDYIGATTSTFGSLPELYGAALPAAAGVVGMTVSAKNEIGFLTFRGYSTTSTGIGLLADASSDGSLFHHLEVDSCRNGVDFDGSATADSLINSVIDGGSLTNANGWRATTSTAVSVYLYNNIIVNCKTGLTKAPAQTLVETNNCFFNNSSADYAGSLNASDLLVNPLFRSPVSNDYRPAWTSGVLNKGLTIHSGAGAFIIRQTAADIGVWEVDFVINKSGWQGGWSISWKGGW